MKIFWLTALALTAFAANSLLARAALLGGDMSGLLFTIVRIISGALALAVLVGLTRPAQQTPPTSWREPRSWAGAVMLLLYALMFSLAYLQLETGLGALCLFATVQLTILGLSARSGELRIVDIIGAGIALAGLTYLVWPNIGTPRLGGIMLMGLSGVGWGVYTWLGRGKSHPLLLTSHNFTLASWLCLPLCALALFSPIVSPGLIDHSVTQAGIILSIISGAITSGLGYAVWYQVLPRLSAATSGIAQLLVPPLAALMGWAVLAETLTPRFWLATAVILAGLILAQSRQWAGPTR